MGVFRITIIDMIKIHSVRCTAEDNVVSVYVSREGEGNVYKFKCACK